MNTFPSRIGFSLPLIIVSVVSGAFAQPRPAPPAFEVATVKPSAPLDMAAMKAGTAHEEFLQAYIGKNDTAYRAGWRSLVFSGQATMPKSLEGDAAVVEFVAHNPGAVGYIGKASPHEGVKVLAVK